MRRGWQKRLGHLLGQVMPRHVNLTVYNFLNGKMLAETEERMSDKREIKCRGIRIDNGEWAYGTGITDFLNSYPANKNKLWLWSDYGWVEVRPDSVCQYLHCQDHNGQDEYEGDIVKTDTGVIGTVKLSLKNFHRYIDWNEEQKDLYEAGKFPYNYHEITGSIHKEK